MERIRQAIIGITHSITTTVNCRWYLCSHAASDSIITNKPVDLSILHSDYQAIVQLLSPIVL
jgi:nicotinamide riboside kinase